MTVMMNSLADMHLILNKSDFRVKRDLRQLRVFHAFRGKIHETTEYAEPTEYHGNYYELF